MPDLEFSWIFCAKMWSISVAVDCVILVGLEITGIKLWSSKVSKYLEVSTCISVFKISILKSPTRISSHFFRFVSSLICTKTVFRISVKSLILVWGGR